MVRSVEHYPSETIVVVYALLRKAPHRIKNATIHDYELEVYEIHKVTELTENVPFTVYDAENINRDTEDVDEEDVEDSSILSGTGTPEGSKSPVEGKFARVSTDLSKFSIDKLRNRSKYSACQMRIPIANNKQRVWMSIGQIVHSPNEFG